MIDPGVERKEVAGEAGGVSSFGLILEPNFIASLLGGIGGIIGETGAEVDVESLEMYECWLWLILPSCLQVGN